MTDKRTYGFSLWPNEEGWERSMLDVWRAGALDRRIEMDMTPAEWSAFSSSLERQGLTLREVESREVDDTTEVIKRPTKGTAEWDLWIAAIEVSSSAPLRGGTNVHAAKVPWTYMKQLRSALEGVGIDWRKARA